MMWLAVLLFWLSPPFKSDFDGIKSKVNILSYYNLTITSYLAIHLLVSKLASLPEILWVGMILLSKSAIEILINLG